MVAPNETGEGLKRVRKHLSITLDAVNNLLYSYYVMDQDEPSKLISFILNAYKSFLYR
jgi:hypothetical protein